jgi:hypothetical protein
VNAQTVDAETSAAAAPLEEAPIYTFSAESCQGRRVLVFDEARTNRLAMDGMLAWITMLGEQASQKKPGAQDEGPALVKALEAAGCTVEHWREPAVSIDTDGKKKWVLLGEGEKEKYQPTYKLKGKETRDYDAVISLSQGQAEHTKQSRNEALKITFKNEAEIQVRGRENVRVDGSWVYAEETGLQEFAPYTEKQEAEERVRAEGAKQKTAAEEKFHKELQAAVQAALPPR